MNQSDVNKILADTENGYDKMSVKFSETRKYFWRGLEFIGSYVKDGDNVFDFGCGNGRLLELFPNKKIEYCGVDTSGKLIEIAKQKYDKNSISFQKISSSGSLPFPNDYFNVVYSIAVFHHFPGKKYRETMAKELYRIMKSEEFVIITVWNLWQKKYFRNIIKNWADKLLGRSKLDWNDCCITFKDNEGKIFKRYHHAFSKKELCDLFFKAGFKMEKCENIDNKNLVYIGKK